MISRTNQRTASTFGACAKLPMNATPDRSANGVCTGTAGTAQGTTCTLLSAAMLGNLFQLLGFALRMRDDAIGGQRRRDLLQREDRGLTHQLGCVLRIELALRLEAQMMQIGDAVDDLRIKVSPRHLQTTRRGFHAVQIDKIESPRRARGRNR